MSFLAPLFLAGALAAAIPVVLHLLKREPEPRVKFAVVKLLRHAPVELTKKRHLRELLLLALRVAAFVLLALAFARPFFPSVVRADAPAAIVAVDTSDSMSAPGRFDRARQLARDAIGRQPAGTLVGVIRFSDSAEIVARPSEDRALTIAAIDALKPGPGGTRYRAALGAAAQALGARRGEIVVVTDLQENGWDAGDRASLPASTRITVADVGEPPADLAVTSVRPRADGVVATIRNTANRARDARVHLKIDGRAAGDATVSVPANGAADAAWSHVPRGTSASVEVDDPGGAQGDNTRFAVLGRSAKPTVVVVTSSGDLAREGFYVQQALVAPGAADDGYDVRGAAAIRLGLNGRGDTDAAVPLDDAAAVVLMSTRGLERRGREALAAYVQGGGGVMIAASADIDGDVVADVLGGEPLRIATDPESNAGNVAKPVERTLTPADVRHPVFKIFDGTIATLGLVKFRQVARIGGGGCQPLARFTSGETAVADCPAGEGRAVVFASDLNNKWNDFPVHATFVPFLREAVAYVAAGRTNASEYYVGDAPASVPPVPGVVQLAGGPHPRLAAVNVDPRESDPRRLTADEFQSAVLRLKDAGRTEARLEARQQEDRQHIWEYLLVLMMAAMALEGVVASRTA